MAGNPWALSMAPTPMLPSGMGQNHIANILRLYGFGGDASQFPDAPQIWPTPQGSPPANDPDNWLGNTRNALGGVPQNILAALLRYHGVG